MKELIDKLSSYNLFNYLLPGALFVAAAARISDFRLADDNVIEELVVCYFIGLVISRIGSLVVEPVLRWVGFVKFAPYGDFIKACEQDARIELLSEQNNVYRTLCALGVVLLAFKALDVGANRLGLIPDAKLLIVSAGLAILFVFAYRKQTSFVRKRVEARAK